LQSKPEKSRPSTSSSPAAGTPRVERLHIPIAELLGWISGLSDVDTGWFLRLLFNAAASERQGYLCDSPDLWRLAGARRSDFWESHKSSVLAGWKREEIDGIGWLHFPPLLTIINEGIAKLQNYRARSTHSLTGVDLKNQKQNQSECVEEVRPKTEAAKNADRQPTLRDRSIFD